MKNRVRLGLLMLTIVLMVATGAMASSLTVVVKCCDGSMAIANRVVRFEYDTGFGPQSQEIQTDGGGLATCSNPNFGPGTVVTVSVKIPPSGPDKGGWAIFEADHGSLGTPDWTPELPSRVYGQSYICSLSDGDPDEDEVGDGDPDDPDGVWTRVKR